MNQEAIKVEQLTVSYEKTPVLWDLSFTVPAGKLVGIIGPNGAGKSTLLKTALGMLKPVAGSVSFFGQGYRQMQQKIAYVPQREAVDWDFPIRVIDVVLMGRYGRLGLFRWVRRADREAAHKVLETVGLTGYEERQISQLSGGQQQRVFLARALMQEADLYFLDEPFAGIDAATERVMCEVMRNLRDEGKTVFVVHHDLNTVCSTFDWVVMLNMRLTACGPVDEVFTSEAIDTTYGKNAVLLGEAARLSQTQTSGLR